MHVEQSKVGLTTFMYGRIKMSELLSPGDILCFYEVLNPEGGMAGMMVKETRERNLDDYVQWAQQQQVALPPGHTFYRAMWVKVSDSNLKEPFIPTNVPFQFNADNSVMLGDEKWWLDHIFTLYSDGYETNEENAGRARDDAKSGDFFFEEE